MERMIIKEEPLENFIIVIYKVIFMVKMFILILLI